MTNTNQPKPTGVPDQQQEQQVGLLPGAPQPTASASRVSDKSFLVTWLFAWLLGFFAIDRFYLGKVGTGVLKLITFSGFGIWWLVDVILTLAGSRRDKQGRALAGYAQHKKVAIIVTLAATALSLIVSSVAGSNSSPDVAGAPAADAAAESSEIAPAAEPAAAESAEAEPAADTDTVQSWADDRFGTFSPVTQTGTGDNLITLPAGATAGLVTASHDGSSNFSLSVLDAANASTGQLLVNTIGGYTGTTPYGFSSFGEPGVTLQVTADGNWSLTMAPVAAASAVVGSGVGNNVFLYDGDAGRLTATHDGSSNFSVLEETGEAFSMGLLVNEIGAYSGTVPLSAGPSVITVGADGNWTLLAE